MDLDKALAIVDAMMDPVDSAGWPEDEAAAVRYLLVLSERLRDAWTPIPLRWRHTAPGDAFIGEGGTLWRITATAAHGGQWALHVAHGGEPPTRYLGDPDETVDVLVPVAERDALVLAREQLGARITDRKVA